MQRLAWAYSLVIEAHNLRDDLDLGSVTPIVAANIIADYSARLWNSAVTLGDAAGNPFLAYLLDPSSLPTSHSLPPEAVAIVLSHITPANQLSAWLAVSAEIQTKTIAARQTEPVVTNPTDPELLQGLLSPEGHANGDLARQSATALLVPLLGPDSSPQQLEVTFFAATAIAGAQEVAAGRLPVFSDGAATGLVSSEGQLALSASEVRLAAAIPAIWGILELCALAPPTAAFCGAVLYGGATLVKNAISSSAFAVTVTPSFTQISDDPETWRIGVKASVPASGLTRVKTIKCRLNWDSGDNFVAEGLLASAAEFGEVTLSFTVESGEGTLQCFALGPSAQLRGSHDDYLLASSNAIVVKASKEKVDSDGDARRTPSMAILAPRAGQASTILAVRTRSTKNWMRTKTASATQGRRPKYVQAPITVQQLRISIRRMPIATASATRVTLVIRTATV